MGERRDKNRQKNADPHLTPIYRAVYFSLNEVLGDRNVNAKNFGYWARRTEGAYIGNFMLQVQPDTKTNANTYTIKCTNPERK